MGRKNKIRHQKSKEGDGDSHADVINTGRKRDRIDDSDGTCNVSHMLNGKRNEWKADFRDPADQRNSMLESYYKMQVFFNKDHPLHRKHSTEIFKVEDWDTCYKYLKQPLMMAYRINSAHPDCHNVRALLEREMNRAGFIFRDNDAMKDTSVVNSDSGDINTILHSSKESSRVGQTNICEDNQDVKDPSANGVVMRLSYVPHRLAFQADLSRGELKRLTVFKHLKRVFAALNDDGMLTRQEAVSMLPPLLLDVHPGMTVLDMCAAPGSKTSQLLEAMVSGEYWASGRAIDGTIETDRSSVCSGNGNNNGCVVANDVNISRIDILTHQTNRAPNAHQFLVITNNDATTYPLFMNSEDKFDRVLCDVMCSGDGTLRKSADLWTRWNPLQGASLHQTQLKTLLRGMSLVKCGGVVVYSTCSMNPVEDEAVIASALLESNGAFVLIDKDEMLLNNCRQIDEDGVMMVTEDVGSIMQGLRYSKGIVDWFLMNRDGTVVFENFASAMAYRQDVMNGKGFQYYPSMFPPHKRDSTSAHVAVTTISDADAINTAEEAKPTTKSNINNYVNINADNYHTDPLHLSRCIRILPHMQNTGGFFIAALRCVRDYSVENNNANKRGKSKQERTITVHKEVPSNNNNAEVIVHNDRMIDRNNKNEIHPSQTANNNKHMHDKPPVFMPIPKMLRDALVRSLDVRDCVSNSNAEGCLPFDRIFVRYEHYKDTLVHEDQHNTSKENVVTGALGNNDNIIINNDISVLGSEAPAITTEIKAPRTVKMYLAAPGVASMVLRKLDPSRVNVLHMGTKIVESYVKYSHDKLRFHLDGLRTIIPYLFPYVTNTYVIQCSCTSDVIGHDTNNKLFALKCPDSRWIVDCLLRGGSGSSSSITHSNNNNNNNNNSNTYVYSPTEGTTTTTALPSVVNNCKARVSVSELSTHCSAVSGCQSCQGIIEKVFSTKHSSADRVLYTEEDVKEEKINVFREIMANRSLALVCSLAPLGLSQPMYLSVELDNNCMTAEIVAQPHQLVLLMLSLGDDLSRFTGGESKISS